MEVKIEHGIDGTKLAVSRNDAIIIVDELSFNNICECLCEWSTRIFLVKQDHLDER